MKKLIRLKPLTPFFFGTNKTFSDENLHDVISSYFPQQTHVLGMLRYFLLQSKGLISLRRRGRWVKNSDFTDAFDLVGGFNKNDKNQTKESLGIINSISTVFLISTDGKNIKDFHFVAPKDTGLDIKAENTQVLSYIANKKREKLYKIENFNSKEGVVHALTTCSFWQNYLTGKIEKRDFEQKVDDSYLESLNLKPFHAVFQEVAQIGNKRDSKTKTVKADDEGSFYKKTSYTFEENYEFGFIVDVKEDRFEKKDGFVYFGAERSMFKIIVDAFSDNLKKLYPNTEINSNKQITLSDVEVENFNDIEFMLNEEYIAHAYMERKFKKQHRSSSKYSKSKQKHFIPRGSVIYFKDDFDSDALDKTLGYNSLLKGERK